MSEQPTGVDEAPRLVSLRTLVLSVVVTWVLSVGAALALPFASIGGPGASEQSNPRAAQASRAAARTSES